LYKSFINHGIGSIGPQERKFLFSQRLALRLAVLTGSFLSSEKIDLASLFQTNLLALSTEYPLVNAITASILEESSLIGSQFIFILVVLISFTLKAVTGF